MTEYIDVFAIAVGWFNVDKFENMEKYFDEKAESFLEENDTKKAKGIKDVVASLQAYKKSTNAAEMNLEGVNVLKAIVPNAMTVQGKFILTTSRGPKKGEFHCTITKDTKKITKIDLQLPKLQ